MRIALALVFLAAPAVAQEAWDSAPDIAACMAADDATAKRACIGKAAENCMETSEGGYTTLGMSMCAAAETDGWDAVLNAEYTRTMDWSRAMDAEDQTHFPEFAKREETLRAAQRAWIAFRDAECGYAYAQWGAGSMRHIAGTSCMLDMTATRAIELFEMREVMR